MKKSLMIKWCLIVVMSLSASAMWAQADLQIGRVFDLYGHSKGCKMVELHHSSFRGYELEVYKSLVYSRYGNAIEAYLKTDRKNARKVREIVEDGIITSGYYMMKPVRQGLNRYILFRNGSKQSGTVVYIEGALTPDELMKLCTPNR
jgi:hypothetical protein